MSANKNAQLRYQILDRCFSNFRRQYTIEDLVEEVNEKLYDINGTGVSLRQIREDIKFMRDSVGYDAPIEAYPYDGRKGARPERVVLRFSPGRFPYVVSKPLHSSQQIISEKDCTEWM